MTHAGSAAFDPAYIKIAFIRAHLFRTSCAPPFGPCIRTFKVLLHFSALFAFYFLPGLINLGLAALFCAVSEILYITDNVAEWKIAYLAIALFGQLYQLQYIGHPTSVRLIHQ